MSKKAFVAIWWPVICGSTIAIETILAVLIFFGPLEMNSVIASQLTEIGLTWFRPERDVPIYTRGCALGALLIAGLALLWDWRMRRAGDSGEERLIRSGIVEMQIFSALFVAGVTLLMYERWTFATERISHIGVVFGFTAPILALMVIGIGFFRPFPVFIPAVTKKQKAKPSRNTASADATNSRFWLDSLIVLLLVLVIYIPNCNTLAGFFFRQEEFHHWDFFAMGPTLAFQHGKALGLDFYSQYGVGWALLFNGLSPVLPISYAGMLRFVTTYGCLYFVGLFFLMKAWLRNSAWAAVAVLFALTMQIFHGLDLNEVMWRYPSSTVIRSAVDVWVFFALLYHLRTARAAWAVLAGALVGIAMLLEMDTGIYVAATFCGYWVWSLGLKDSARRPRMRVVGLSFASLVSVFLAGMWIASRGSLLSPAFWKGLVESLVDYPDGISMLPFVAIPDWTLLLFVLVIVTYFGTFGHMVVKCLRRECEPGDLFAGCIASYGMASMLLFMGRSYPHNLFHVSIPFSVLVVAGLARLYKVLAQRAVLIADRETRKFWQSLVGSLPWLALVSVLFWLWINPVAQFYPGLLKRAITGPTDDGLFLLSEPKDVGGLPPEAVGYVNAFQAVTRKLHDLSVAGNSVAVLDNTDTIFYLASSVVPWGRYSPGMAALITKKQLDHFIGNIETNGPRYVMIRPNESHAGLRGEQQVWLAVRHAVERHYHPSSSFVAFEIWERN